MKYLSQGAKSNLLQGFVWGVRLVFLIFLLSLITPVQPRAELGAPQTVETHIPQLCVHTRLIDEVDEWKIQRSLEMVREMGATTITEFFPWAYIEHTRGVYQWDNVDRIVRHAQNQGIRIIARMGFVPSWARETHDDTETTLNTLPETSYIDFSNFVAAFASRYAGTIDHIIIWNEPNLAFEWGYRQVSAQAYARLLEAVYEPAHRANPNVILLAAPLAPTLEPRGSSHGLNDLLYFEDLYASGASQYFDAVAVHTYGFTTSALEAPATDRLNFRRMELLRDLMINYGDEEKPIYITETGWNDHPRWTNAVTPAQRIAYSVEAVEYAQANSDWLQNLCFWVFRFPAPTYNYPDHFTFVNSDFEPKPIYFVLQNMARDLSTSEQLWRPSPLQDSEN